MGRRYGAAVSPGRTAAVLQSVSERWCGESRYSAGFYLQYRRESLGPLELVAARVREGMREQVQAALLRLELRTFVHGPIAERYKVSSNVRRVRIRSGKAGAFSGASGEDERSRFLATLAGRRSAVRGRAPGCPVVHNTCSE